MGSWQLHVLQPQSECLPCSALQASKVLDCLLQDSAAHAPGSAPATSSFTAGSSSPRGSVATVWELLALLNAQQLKALSSSPRFYDLHHTDAPGWLLPEAAVDAALQVGCCWQAGLGLCTAAAHAWCCPLLESACRLAVHAAGPAGGGNTTVAGAAVAGSN